jgi:hypothetical protein
MQNYKLEREVKKRAEWKSIKKAGVRIGLQCNLRIRRRRRVIFQSDIYAVI